MHVDGLVAAAVGLVPHLGEEFSPGDDIGAGPGEVCEEVELEAGQIERLTVESCRAASGVDHERGDDQPVAVGGRVGVAAEHRADASVDLRGREGFDDVVVGAGVEEPDDLGLVVAGGGHDHRCRGDAAEHGQDLAAVEVGEAKVEDDDVGLPVDRGGERVGAGGLGAHRVASVGETAYQRGADVLIVLDDEHRRHLPTIRNRREVRLGLGKP